VPEYDSKDPSCSEHFHIENENEPSHDAAEIVRNVNEIRRE
jgi:hypothetical protein